MIMQNYYKQLKSNFKITTNWKKYWLKVIIQRQNQYLDYLIDPSFQEVNRFTIWRQQCG